MNVKILPTNPVYGKSIILAVSKTAPIRKLKEALSLQIEVPPEDQIFIYGGKILVDTVTVIEYGIKLGDAIVFKRKEPLECERVENSAPISETCKKKVEILTDVESKYYKLGDIVDACFIENGSWYEGKLLKIFTKEGESGGDEEESYYYRVKGDRHVVPFQIDLKFNQIRPVSRQKHKLSDLKPDMVVLVNYNVIKPKTRGQWYDLIITEVSKNSLKGTLLVGPENAAIENCTIKFLQEIMKIEPAVLLSERESERLPVPPLREYPINCNKCKDARNRKCKECGCRICGGKEHCDSIVLCDDCDFGFHIGCLDPPLETVPDDQDWYCPDCKTNDSEIVKAGEAQKDSKKKKIKLPANNTESRDWGRGMACTGRTSICTIVAKDHFGAIPGVDVGTCWKFRMQVSEAGVHRSSVAGIHGRENHGAYSIVLSGGYEDDVDNGYEVFYTGSGGRDLTNNRRSNVQSADQKLTKMNKALALNCNAPIDPEKGATAKDWKKGKPVRVVRNYKGAKHSKFAPTEGNRYDGIYRVVKYYPEVGKSGFKVWKYCLRRDDPEPAPWDDPNYVMNVIYPPNYLETKEAEEKLKRLEKDKTETEKTPNKKSGISKTPSKKRKITDMFQVSPKTPAKKPKLEAYKLPKDVEKLVNQDEANEENWSKCRELLKEGKKIFLEKVQEIFMCCCCQDLVLKPVTTVCKHNYCKACMKAAFKSGIETCPLCRFKLDTETIPEINEKLRTILMTLFPGYEARQN